MTEVFETKRNHQDSDASLFNPDPNVEIMN